MSERKKRLGSRRALAKRNGPSEPGETPPAPQVIDAGSSQPLPAGPTGNLGEETEAGVSPTVNACDSVADLRHPAEEGVQHMSHAVTPSSLAQPERCVEVPQASEHNIAFSHDGERERSSDSRNLSHLLSDDGQNRSPHAADLLNEGLSWQDELLNCILHVGVQELPTVPEMETSTGNCERVRSTVKPGDEVSVIQEAPTVSGNQAPSEQELLGAGYKSNAEETLNQTDDTKPATSESFPALKSTYASVLDPHSEQPAEHDRQESAVSPTPPTADPREVQGTAPSEHDAITEAASHDSTGSEVDGHVEEALPESSGRIESNSDDQSSRDLAELLTPTTVSREELMNIETKDKDLEACDALRFVSADFSQLQNRNDQDENHNDGGTALFENEEQREQFTLDAYSEDEVGRSAGERHAPGDTREPDEAISQGQVEDLALRGAPNVEDTADNEELNLVQDAQTAILGDIGNVVQERVELSEKSGDPSAVSGEEHPPYTAGETKNEMENLETFERFAESHGTFEHDASAEVDDTQQYSEAENDDATLLAENEEHMEDLTSVLSSEDTIVEQGGDEVRSSMRLDGHPSESVSSADVQTDTGDAEPQNTEVMADREMLARSVEHESSSRTMEAESDGKHDGDKAGVGYSSNGLIQPDVPTGNPSELHDGIHEASSLLEDTSVTEANSESDEGEWEHVIEGQIGPSAVSLSAGTILDPDVSPLLVQFEMVQDIGLSDTFESHDFATKIALPGDERDSVTVSTPSKDEQHLERFPMLDASLNPEDVLGEDEAQLSETHGVHDRPKSEVIELSEDIDTLAGTLQTDPQNTLKSNQSETITKDQPTLTREENRQEPHMEATESNSQVNVSGASNTSSTPTGNRRKMGSSRRNKGTQPVKSDVAGPESHDHAAGSLSLKDGSHDRDIVDVVGQSPSLTESSPQLGESDSDVNIVVSKEATSESSFPTWQSDNTSPVDPQCEVDASAVQPESDSREGFDASAGNLLETHKMETQPVDPNEGNLEEPSMLSQDGPVMGTEEPSDAGSNRTGSRRKLGSSRRNKGRQPVKNDAAGPVSHDRAAESPSSRDLSCDIVSIVEQPAGLTESFPQRGESDNEVMDVRSQEVAGESSDLTLQSDTTSLLEPQCKDDGNMAEGFSVTDMQQIGLQEETAESGEIQPTTPSERSAVTPTIADAQEARGGSDKKESDLEDREELSLEEEVLYSVPGSSVESQAGDEHQVKFANCSFASEQLTPTTGPSEEPSPVIEIKASGTSTLHGVSEDLSQLQNEPNQNSSERYNDQDDSANVLFKNEELRLAMLSEEKLNQASGAGTEASDDHPTDPSPVSVSLDTLEVSGTDTMNTNHFADVPAEKLSANQADVLGQSQKQDEPMVGNRETEEALFGDVESNSSVQVLQSETNSSPDFQSDDSPLMTTKDGSHEADAPLGLADETIKSGNLGDTFETGDFTESADFAAEMVLSEEKAGAESKSDDAAVSTPNHRTAEQHPESFAMLDASLSPEDVISDVSEAGAQSSETRLVQDQPESEVTDVRDDFYSLFLNPQVELQNTPKSDQGENMMGPTTTSEEVIEEPSSSEGNVLDEDKPSNTSSTPTVNRRKMGSSRRNKGRQPVKSDVVEATSDPAESVSPKDGGHDRDIVDVVGQSPSLTESSPQLGESDNDVNIVVPKEATSESSFPTWQSDNTSPVDPQCEVDASAVQPESDSREGFDASAGNLLETHEMETQPVDPNEGNLEEPRTLSQDGPVMGTEEPSDAGSNRTGSRRKLGSSRRNKGRQPVKRNSAEPPDDDKDAESASHDGAAAETYIPELQQDDQIKGSAPADGHPGPGGDQHTHEEVAFVEEAQRLDRSKERETLSQDCSESESKVPEGKKASASGNENAPSEFEASLVSEIFSALQTGLNTSGFSESQPVDDSAHLFQSGVTRTGDDERRDLKPAEEVGISCPSIHVIENQQTPSEEENVLEVSGLDTSDSEKHREIETLSPGSRVFPDQTEGVVNNEGGETSDGMSSVTRDAPASGESRLESALKDSEAVSPQSPVSGAGHLATTREGSHDAPEENSENSKQKKRKLGSTRRSQLNRKHEGLNAAPDNVINVTAEDEARTVAPADLLTSRNAELLLSNVGEEKQETADQLTVQDPQPTMQDSVLPDQVTAPGEDWTAGAGISQSDYWTQDLDSSLVSFNLPFEPDFKLFQENTQTTPVVEERILKLDVQEQETWRQTDSDAVDVSDAADTQSDHAPDRRRKLGSSRKKRRDTSNQDELSQTQPAQSEESEAAANPFALDEEVPASEPNKENAAVGFSMTADQQATSPLMGEESEAAVSRCAPQDLAAQSPGGRRRKMGSHRKSHGGLSHQRQTRETGGEIETIVEDVEQDLRRRSEVKEKSFVEELDGGNRDETPQRERSHQRSSCGDPRTSSLGATVGFIGDCYNVVMVGDSSVGKTSFMRRAQSGKFSLEIPPSIGLDTCFWTVIVDGTPVVLQLWDTAGQERFHSITRNVFYKAQAFLLMYDVTSVKSFSNVRYWAGCIQEGAAGDASTLLLGNKCDEAARQVTSAEGEAVAMEYNMSFMECSAATGDNVIESLEAVARLVSQKASRREGNVVLDDDGKQKKRSGCC